MYLRRGNRNREVFALQWYLNIVMKSGLKEDGIFGAKTDAAVRAFQRAHKPLRVDGIVGPKTNAALIAAVKKAGKTPKPTTPSTANTGDDGLPKTATPLEKQGIMALHKAASAPQHGDQIARELDAFVKEFSGTLKAIAGTLAIGTKANEFVNFFKILRGAGFSPKEIGWLLNNLLSKGIGTQNVVNFITGLGKAGGGISASLKLVGKINALAVMFASGIEAGNHFNMGRYGAAAGVIYRAGMSVAVPWAALVNGLQMILQAAYPAVKGNRAFDITFTLLRAINPVALGEKAVDSFVTVVQGAVDSFRAGRLDTRALEALADRMRKGPTEVFAKLGDRIGDKLGDWFGEWFYRNFRDYI